METKNELIGLREAAQLANVDRRTIQDWEKKGWLTVAVKLAPRTKGRPGKLYKADDVKKIAIERGRNIEK